MNEETWFSIYMVEEDGSSTLAAGGFATLKHAEIARNSLYDAPEWQDAQGIFRIVKTTSMIVD